MAKVLLSLSFVVLMVFTCSADAWANACESQATGNWEAAGTWTNCGGTTPGASDDVTIKNGHTVTITNTTTKTINTLTVETGAVLTHSVQTDTGSPWVASAVIDISATSMTITGSINVASKGYGGDLSYDDTGRGPGGGTGYWSSGGGAGGGHGGNGGAGGNASGGSGYDYLKAPIEPGSQGGTNYYRDGGYGGGAVKLTVTGAGDSLDIGGTINAEGGDGIDDNGYSSGGGSGGSVYINMSGGGNITGAGTISVVGGDSSGGAGGGGRVAIVGYGTLSSVTVNTYGGNGTVTDGGAGTYVYQASSGNGTLLVDNGTNTGYTKSSMGSIDGAVTFDAIHVRNGGNFEIISGERINLTASSFTAPTAGVGKFTVSGSFYVNQSADSFSVPKNMHFVFRDTDPSTSTYPLFQSYDGSSAYVDLTLDTDGDAYGSGDEDGTLVFEDFTNTSTKLEFNSVTVNGKITHTANNNASNSLTDKIKFKTQTLSISATGIIDVDSLGYSAQTGVATDGYGPSSSYGRGDVFQGSGGGHGGAGGASATQATAGSAFDSSTAPVDHGGSGGTGWSADSGAGGGSVEIEIVASGTAFTHNGTITADGGAGSNASYGSGGGAGGSVYINMSAAGDITGTGTVSADGGAGGDHASYNGGGGGGGRISIVGYTSITSLTYSYAGGSGPDAASDGSAGSLNVTPVNSSPNAPTSLSPADGSTTYDFTPTLSFTLDDPDASEQVQYRIQIDDTSDFSSLVVDYTSALASEGATSFTVGQAAGSGTYATGSSSTTLTPGTSYYWRVKAIDDSAAESSYATANSGSVAFVVAQPSVTLSVADSPLAEAGGVATVTATLSTSAAQSVTVNLSYSGTATNSTDYTPSGTSIVVAAGDTTGTVTLTGVTDTLDETNESIIVDISSVTNGSESGTQQVTASITDDDTPPTVTLSVTGTPFAENGGAATVTATLSAASGQSVTVNLSYSGTAALGTDYTPSGTSIVISAGDTSGTVTLTGDDDSLDEAAETVIADISSVTNGTETGTQQVTASITDDDSPPTVTLGLSGSPLAENGGTATVTASLSTASGQDVTVNLSYSGTATNSSDYTRSGTSITISAGDSSGTVTLTGVNDALDETDETIVVDISTVDNGTESGTQQVSASITDDDAAPTVTLSATSASIAENGGTSNITATLSAVSGQNVTVNLSFSGTATQNTDYTVSSSSITVTAGSLTGTATVTGVNQLAIEGNETIIADISGVTNGTESGTQSTTITIIDSNTAPVISDLLVYNSDDPAEEGQEDATGITTLTPYFEFLYDDDDNHDATLVNLTVFIDAATDTEYWSLDDDAGGTGTQFADLLIDEEALEDIQPGEASVRIPYLVEGAPGNDAALELEWCTTYTVRAKVWDSPGAESNEIQTTFKTNCSPELDEIDDVIADELGTTTVSLAFTDSESDSVQVTCSAPTLRRAGIDINDYVTVNGDNTVRISIGERAYFSQLSSVTSGTHSVTCTISDGSLTSTQTFNLSFGSSNNAPVLASIADYQISEGETLSISLSATDADGDEITLSGQSLPRGATVTDSGGGAGVFRWSPSSSQSGSYQVSVVATDDGNPGKAGTDTFTVTVGNVNQAPVIASVNANRISDSSASLVAEINTAYEWAVSATDADSDVISYSLSGAPSGMSINSSTGVITWTPSSGDLGDVTFSAVASDGSESASVTIHVEVVQLQQAVADAGESVTVMGGRRVRLNGTNSTNARTYAWSQERGNSATLTNADESVAIVVTPRAGGTLLFSLTVTGGNGSSDTDYVRISVLPNEVAVSEFTGRNQRPVLAMDAQGRRLEVASSQSSNEDGQSAHCVNFTTSRVRGYGNYWWVADWSRDNYRGRLWRVLKGRDVCGDDVESISGFSEGDRLGYDFIVADLDGDTSSEVTVSAPGAGDEGQAYVFSDSLELQSLITDANFAEARLEHSDLDQDSYEDLTVLTRGESSSVSYVYRGRSNIPSNVLLSEDADTSVQTGFRIDSIRSGDLNGDGLNETILGSSEASRIFIFNGVEGEMSSLDTDDADTVIVAPPTSDGFGEQVLVTDITGDGVNDLIIGSPNEGDAEQGAIYMVPGTSEWDAVINISEEGMAMRVQGEEAGSRLGDYLLSGDTNGDGIDDLILYDSALGVTHYVSLADVVELTGEPEELLGLRAAGGGGCDLECAFENRRLSQGTLFVLSLLALAFVSSLLFLQRKSPVD